jgi:DNA polymerase I-like protein with 3'-5' exonuclease and polymerase domains
MFTQPAPTDPIDLDHLLRGEVGDVGEVHTLQKVSEPSEEKSEWCEKSTVHRESIDGHHRPPQPPQPARGSIFCTDLKDLERVAKALTGEHRIALDLETYGPKKGGALDPFRGDIRLLTVAGHRGPVWMLDLKTLGYELGPLKTVLEGAEIVAHNAKFDLLWLRVKCGVNPRKVVCTLTASRLLTAGTKPGNSLDQCLWRHLQIEPGKDLGHSDWGAIMLTNEQFAYASRDVAHLHDLAGTLEHEIEVSGLDQVWMLERGLLPCVVDMESAGIAVDRDKLERIATGQRTIADQAADDLRTALGTPKLNLASPVQLVTALREAGLDLKSTREEELKRVDDDTFVPLLLRHRAAIKRVQQAEALIKHIAADGRIHGRFEPTGTATGRFSSKNPNLQNIGRGDLREAFVAGPGRRFVVADYSQIELRAAAVIAGEDKMIQAYKDGTDLHALTAASVLEIDISEVTKDQRQMAKAINFGNLYGQGDEGLARYARNSYGVEMSIDEAHRMRLKFFKTYGRIKRWHGMAWQLVDQLHEYASTGIGRRRLIPHDASNWDRFTALVNTPVQGGTADGMKYAIVLLSERLPGDARIVSTVHDELVVECPEQDAEAVRTLMIDTMTEAMSDLFPEIPIEVEASIGKSWAEK